MWLWESGFTYDGRVFDTMLGEYILQRGQKEPLSLEACAERHQLHTQKQDTLKEYFKQGMNVSEIPHDELSEYLCADLHATQQLFRHQDRQYTYGTGRTLVDTIRLTNDLAVHLARIYQRGFKVDMKALDKVRVEFETEKTDLKSVLEDQVHKLMGDRPINLNSPEQLSWIIYSRKVNDKPTWSHAYEERVTNTQHSDNIRKLTTKLYRQKAERCNDCHGTGQIRKIRKNGTPHKNTNKCLTCSASGFLYKNNTEVAGLRFNAPDPKWVSANGFSTSKDNLVYLEGVARSRGMKDAELFLQRVRRLSALDTYLSSFVEGIATYVKPDGMLHVRLLQHRTGTGRLSGADPNMQNMPRGGTFPVKKVFVSRWDGGQICEADFAQLEFRVAAFLSQDKVAIEEVATGFDVHSYTAKVITEAGQHISRQDAKAHTFAPLYGASGFGRTPAEASYYQQFTSKYSGIGAWHKKLAKEVITTGNVRTPSGREFAFPLATRRANGSITYFTQVKNYPVQSFATADIVPVSLIYIDKMLHANKLQSCVVNTVHDSIVIDVHPNEKEKVLRIINRTNEVLVDIINKKWDVDFNVPLLLEAKIGNNWLDTKDVA
jgi:DNA polymerase I-like protein with 3'-5' exonuclease and polymerase domains